MFNQSYLRLNSLSRAKRSLLKPLKVKGLKWLWHPFIDKRHTNLGDVCVRTMVNDIFLRMMDDNPSITFQESRRKGELDVPRDPATIRITPDISEIEKCGGRVLAWCTIGTTGWHDRHGYAISAFQDGDSVYGDLLKWMEVDRFFSPLQNRYWKLYLTDFLVEYQVFMFNAKDIAPSLLTLKGYAYVLLYLCYLELTKPRIGKGYRAYFIKHFPKTGNDDVFLLKTSTRARCCAL